MVEPTHRKPSRQSASFPFEELPAELQVRVIRYAMPPNGLLPRPLPNPADHEDWNQEHKEFFVEYQEQLKAKDLSVAVIPSSLFQVNRFFSVEAHAIFLKNVYLVIHIDRLRTHFLTTIIHRVTDFRSYLQYKGVPHFQRMQNFRINFEYDPWWADVKYRTDSSSTKDSDLASCRFVLTEKLRTICDLLATNANIQRLTIKVPCLCNCVKLASPEHGKSVLSEVLAPLKRLRVAEDVQFETWHDPEHCDNMQCNEGLCNELIDALDDDMGRLTGEKLSEPEKTWREIKKIPRVRSERVALKVEDKMEAFWDALNTSPDYLDLIRGLARRTERYMMKQYRTEQASVASISD
ncbi:MAG: hypothetical protein Q9169_002813 [Polycauliona sp. 2 TL-2023]